jgi:hypothetical protein
MLAARITLAGVENPRGQDDQIHVLRTPRGAGLVAIAHGRKLALNDIK